MELILFHLIRILENLLFKFLTVFTNFDFFKNKKLNSILFFVYFHMYNNLLWIIYLYLTENLVANFTCFYLKLF